MPRIRHYGCERAGPRGVWLAAVLLGLTAAAQAGDPDNCLFCHQYHGLARFDQQRDHVSLFYVAPEYVRSRRGPHARLSCTDCHPREEVAVIPHQPVSRVDCARTCHLQDPGGVVRQFTHAPIQEQLQRSVHTTQVFDALKHSGGPLLEPGQSHCLYCHDEPVYRDPGRVIPLLAEGFGDGTFDRCNVCHAEQIPVDVAFYVRHISSRLQPERASLEMAQACGVCHADPEVLAEHKLPNSVASYLRSFHGKAALLGDEKTANCVQCHVARGANAHLMLGPENPLSSVSPQRVADSCRSIQCHPGAEMRLASVGVHLDLAVDPGTWEYLLAGAFLLLTVMTFGPSMVIVVLELVALVIGRQHAGAEELEALAEKVWEHPEGRRRLTRFTVSQRFQHWILALLFALLALTGFPMKFASEPWARYVIDTLGGLDNARFIHHWAGLALCIGLAVHLVYIATKVVTDMAKARHLGKPVGLFGAIGCLPMWVGPRDGLQMLHLFAYLLHLRHDRPIFDRFNVKEKFEYVGVFWGTVLLGITGGLLWAEQIASYFITGRVLNLALIAHTYEAFLAIIHVGILHIINVMLTPAVFPLSLATITGKTPIAVLAEEHTGQVLAAAEALHLTAEEDIGHG